MTATYKMRKKEEKKPKLEIIRYSTYEMRNKEETPTHHRLFQYGCQSHQWPCLITVLQQN